jgi:Amt family ammonium transporter
MGAWDFAGGTVVHVNAGIAALVAALVVGKRHGYPSSSLLPHSVPLTLLGAGLLWFGWFGFNAGSALAAGPIAGLAFVTTMLAPAATLVVWTFLDLMRSGKPTAVGAATAIVVGLVAITPAAGFISPMNAIFLGAIAAVPSYCALVIRAKTSLDDSLDVVAAHGVGGTVGALLTGVFAEKAVNGLFDGAIAGNPMQVVIQGVAVLTAMGRSCRCAPVRMTRAWASTSASTAKRRTCTRASHLRRFRCRRCRSVCSRRSIQSRATRSV